MEKKVPIKYRREIPDLEIFQDSGDKQWYTQYIPKWKHDLDYSWDEHDSKEVGGYNNPSVVHFTKTHRIKFETEYYDGIKEKVEFWLVSKTEDGTMNFLEEIPASMEDIESQISVRIHEYDISRFNSQLPLYIVMKVKTKKNYIIDTDVKDGASVPFYRAFPENFNPRREDHRLLYTLYNDNNERRTIQKKAFQGQRYFPNSKIKFQPQVQMTMCLF